MRLIFNLYSTFNALFKIQLSIQHSFINLYSVLHSRIQLSIQQFQLFIQNSTLIFKTFNYSVNFQLYFNIPLFIQHSTIRFSSLTLLSSHYFWSVTHISACQKDRGGGG